MQQLVAFLLLLGCAISDDSDGGSTKKGEMLQYLQPDDVDSGVYDDTSSLPEHICTRTCKEGQNRICYYRFVLEPYATMGKACNDCFNAVKDCYNKQCVTADGFERSILTINRRLPAPSIQVCAGDLIVADVKNMMAGRSTTIHWHGIKHKGSKFMDGVPMVTQCPILGGEIFRYTFIAEPGTHFYHSHDGLQKVDGIVGSLVVRQPKSSDPNAKLYDFDLPSHVIVVQDWYHMNADSMFPGTRHRDIDQMASSYLIQGRGQFIMHDGMRLADTPLAAFNVTKGNNYLFRIIAGTCYECQYILTFEKHDMIIIGADASSIEPYEVNSLTMSPGERYDIVINCNKDVGAYWIQVRTLGVCEEMGANQVAILKYEGASYVPTSPAPTFEVNDVNNPGLTMSPVNSECTEATRDSEGPCLHDLRGAEAAPADILKEQPDMSIVWAYGFHFFSDEELFNTSHYHKFIASPFDPVSSTINGISNMSPPCPILSQPEDVPSNIMCPEKGYPANTWNVVNRECVHVMKVPANRTIEIVTIDIDDKGRNLTSHPVHLHGYEMYILEMGVLDHSRPFNESYVQLLKKITSGNRKIPSKPVKKDTFPLTAGGYVVSRIYTDNPGYWFFHCHFAYHLDSGMSGILQVGEQSTFPKAPARFPKCGDYLPIPNI